MDIGVVVVTGASGGIGAALARKLDGMGCSLALAARRQAELERVAASCRGKALVVVADVCRRGDVERLRDRALAGFGRVDAWVNVAGRGISRPVSELTDVDFDEMMAVNVKSALYGAQAILPHFKERGKGHLVNVSSFLGRVPMVPARSAYNAAKAALNTLTANLRMELAKGFPGIRVSLVMPGVVATDFARNALHQDPKTAPAVLPNSQTPEEVADAIAGLLENPQAELYTNPASAEMARRYFQDVGAFEAQMGR